MGCGTLITHAIFLSVSETVSSLMVPMVQAAFGTVLMSALGFTPLLLAGLLLAGVAAVALTPVAGPANVKNHPAGSPSANCLS
jgi:hypothetical protein